MVPEIDFHLSLVSMKETSFIRQNKEKWQRFEDLNKMGSKNPDEVSKLFVEITEDLSYARTFYPKRSVRVYLNHIAQRVFTSLYKVRTNPFKKFIQFWTTDLPLEMYRARKNVLFAFLFFAIAMGIGIMSTEADLNFARVILSDSYVEMTEGYIEMGDPMRVYKTMPPFEMFAMIFLNNIRVAFMCFSFGLFFSLGTAFFVLYNGIMVGTFQSFFYYKSAQAATAKTAGLFLTSFLTIWIHGTFEIYSIILAGAAGFTLGNGLLIPGTLTRMQSFQINAKRGLKMMIGITPFIFFAALLESYATRHTEMPEIAKWGIILGSFSIMTAYFILYPFLVAKRNPGFFDLNEEPTYYPPRKIDQFKIRQPNEIFSDTFALFRNTLKFFHKQLWLFHIPITIALFVGVYFLDPSVYYNEEMGFAALALMFENYEFSIFIYLGVLILLTLHAGTVMYSIRKYFTSDDEKKELHWGKFMLTKSWKAFPLVFAFFAAILSLNPLLIFALIFLGGPILFSLYPQITENHGFIHGLYRGIGSGFQGWSANFLLMLIFGAITFLFSMVFGLNNQLWAILIELVNWHFVGSTDSPIPLQNMLTGSVMIVFAYYMLTFIYIGFTLSFLTQDEKEQAHSLYQRLKLFGKKNKTVETDYED